MTNGRKIRDGEADIVIGARSAIFTPLKNIGVIIMDEEHSDTYKSDMSPRYHARETAIFRASQFGAAVVLASKQRRLLKAITKHRQANISCLK